MSSSEGSPGCSGGGGAPAPPTPTAKPASAAQPPAFPLLSLPPPCLLGVFHALDGSLADEVALSLCCKELWELGAAARRRHLCCAACGHAVLDPARAFNSDTFRDTPRLDLPDGESYAVDAAVLQGSGNGGHGSSGSGTGSSGQRSSGNKGGTCRNAGGSSSPSSSSSSSFGATLGSEAPLHAAPVLFCLRAVLGIRRAGDPGYQVRAREVLCGGCGLHLGLCIAQLGRLRAGAITAACISHWRELQLLGACFLAKRYLRLLRLPDGCEEHLGNPPHPSALAPYRCTAARSNLRPPGGCGAELFCSRDILSRQHCWDAGGGPERAFYINSFRAGSVVAENERQEMLCQGEMRVADVRCSACGARVGWKFVSDLSLSLENCNQVGRYGVVRSSIQKDKSKGKRPAEQEAASSSSSQ